MSPEGDHSMSPKDVVQILLATYNGSRYLDAFLDSLLRQDYQGWSLLVRDDCSTDPTPALLERWCARLDGRMKIQPDSGQSNLGVVGNFSRLLTASSAPYVMFADQDDIWRPNKISLTLAAMHQREAAVGNNRPILVHTDLAIVDEGLVMVAPSHWRHQGLVPDRGHELGHMIVENIVWGCTSMLNRPLVELTGEIPREAQFHDWWISLVAAVFGEIVSLPAQTIAWRRHDCNDSEISNLSAVVRRTITGVPEMRRRLSRLFEGSRPRTQQFLSRYRNRLTRDQVAALEAFLDLPTLGFWARRRALLQHRLFFTSRLRTAGLLLLL
jgi:glycosyltransferase involved in cell wall biosynthesis